MGSLSLKREKRVRRGARGRACIRRSGLPRLCVFKTSRHMRVQVIDISGRVLVCASTLEKQVKSQCEGYTGNQDAAGVVGRVLAERCKTAGIEKVAFDRNGYKFHGRVKALAECVRQGGVVC